jgi:hypothetical protein
VGIGDTPVAPGETLGWSAQLDGLGYLKADRATGGVWVCPASRERLQEYKNTYLSWTMPRGPGRNGRTNQYWLVWENLGFVPYPTGVPAPPLSPMPLHLGWTAYAELQPLNVQVDQLGPHQYSSSSVRPFAGFPGQNLFPNGCSHVMYSDMSMAVYQHYKTVNNDVITQGVSTPDRID